MLLVENWNEGADEATHAPASAPAALRPIGAIARQPPPSSKARAEAPPREASEEVHIHIGRIEVAAPQAVAPPAPAPRAPRSTNLQDYLKRGARRAR